MTICQPGVVTKGFRSTELKRIDAQLMYSVPLQHHNGSLPLFNFQGRVYAILLMQVGC